MLHVLVTKSANFCLRKKQKIQVILKVNWIHPLEMEKSHGNLAIGLSSTHSAEIFRQMLYRPKLFCEHTEGYMPLRNCCTATYINSVFFSKFFFPHSQLDC